MTTVVSGRTTASVPRAAAAVLASRTAAQLLGVALTVLLAARLGVRAFGEYAFVSAVVVVANVVTTFGTDMVLIRDIAGDPRSRRCAPALVLQVVLSLAAIAAIGTVVRLLPSTPGDVAAALPILALSLLPAALFSVCTAGLRGAGCMQAYAVVGLVAAAAPLAAVVALVPSGAGVVRAAVALVAAQAVSAAVAWGTCAARVRGLRPMTATRRAEVAEMARLSAPVGILGVLGIVYQRCGGIAVALFAGPVATGWLAAASRITEASKTGHVALFTALYPAMAEAHATGRAPRAVMLSRRVCVAGGALVTATLLLAGPALLERLFGAAFAPAGSGLAVLAAAVLPSTLATHESLALLAAGRARDTLQPLAVSLVTLLAATTALLPAVGWTGACWAILLADTTNAALLTAAARRSSGRRWTRPGMLAGASSTPRGEAA